MWQRHPFGEGCRCSPQAVYKWKRSPEFRERLAEATQAFADNLGQMALDRLKDPRRSRGSDVLLMALLNANRPEKYRRRGEPVDDTALNILKELRAIRQRRREQAALPPPTITVEPAEHKTATDEAERPMASRIAYRAKTGMIPLSPATPVPTSTSVVDRVVAVRLRR